MTEATKQYEVLQHADRERIKSIADFLAWNHVFTTLDNEPNLTGEISGKIANAVQHVIQEELAAWFAYHGDTPQRGGYLCGHPSLDNHYYDRDCAACRREKWEQREKYFPQTENA